VGAGCGEDLDLLALAVKSAEGEMKLGTVVRDHRYEPTARLTQDSRAIKGFVWRVAVALSSS
jgi:hypothetical protein